MSKYYSVQTNNRFAKLNLDSDNEEILSVKPESVVEQERIEAEKDQTRTANTRRQAKNVVTKPSRDSKPVKDYEAKTDDRKQHKKSADRKAKESEQRTFGGRRDGQRKLDKQGGVRKPIDDVDPRHREEEEVLAEVDAKEEAEVPVETDRPPRAESTVPVGMSVSEYMSQMAAERYVAPEGEEVPTKYEDLEKEMQEAGYEPISRDKGASTGAAALKSISRKVTESASVHIAELGELPKLKPQSFQKPDGRMDRGDKTRNKSAPTQKQQTEEVKPKRKAYKDPTVFPEIGE